MSKVVAAKNELASSRYFEYIDVLRVFSMLSVVFLHTAAGSLRGNLDSATWHLSNVLTTVMGTSVPVFFMISGALILQNPKTLSIEVTWKKRIIKMLIPFLIWSLVAVAYFEAVNLVVSGSIRWDVVISRLRNAPSQPTTVHLWFMYVLIPLYVLSPALKKLVDTLTRDLTRYLIILWLVFSSLLPTVAVFVPAKFQSLFTLNQAYNLNFMSGYLGYFLIGYYLFTFERRLSKKLLAAVFAADILIISLGTWLKTTQAGAYSELFKGYTRVFTLILSIALFLMVREFFASNRLPRVVSSVVKFLSPISFGVYLLHNLVVDLVNKKIHIWPADSILTLLAAYFIILLVTIVCIVLLASCKLTCFAFTGLTYENACKTCNIQYLFSKIFKGPVTGKEQQGSLYV